MYSEMPIRIDPVGVNPRFLMIGLMDVSETETCTLVLVIGRRGKKVRIRFQRYSASFRGRRNMKLLCFGIRRENSQSLKIATGAASI